MDTNARPIGDRAALARLASRRHFLQYSSALGIGGASLWLSACSNGSQPSTDPTSATDGGTGVYDGTDGMRFLESLTWPETALPEPEEEVTITIASTWPASLLERQDQFDEFFMSRHPTIKVVKEVTPYADYLQKYLTQMAGGTAPDIMVTTYSWVQQFVRAGWFLPLDDYIARQSDFDAADFTAPSTGFFERDGSTYAVPYDCGPLMLFYNRDMFREFGVEEPSEDWTLDDLMSAALTMTTGEGPEKTFGLNGAPYPDGFFNANYLAPFGGRYLNDDETECLLDRPESIEAAKFWIDPILQHGIAPDDAESQAMGADAFTLGRGAMAIQGTWAAAGLLANADFDWAIAHYPAGPERHTTAAAGSAYAITDQAAQPDAAWIYLNEYLSSSGQIFMWASTGLGSPSRSSAWPAYLESEFAPDGAELALDALNSYGTTEGVNFGPATPKVDATAWPIWEQVLSGGLAVEEGCKQVTTAITPLLEENR